MKIFFVFFSAFLIAGCTRHASPMYIANEDLLITGFPDLPNDAAQVAERLASCSHFSGELSGNGSDRDKELAMIMDELRCHTIARDVTAIREKYADHRAVQDALTAASQL